MHSNGIYHRDIKAANVLVARRPTKDARGRFKLADLGLSNRSASSQTCCGSPGTQDFSKGTILLQRHPIAPARMEHACVNSMCMHDLGESVCALCY